MNEDLTFPDEFDSPPRRSYLMWLFSALGVKYTLFLPLAALVAFVVVGFLIWKGKGPALVGALVFVVPLPVLVGILGVIEGLMAMFQVLAASDTSAPASAIAEGISMSLVSAWVGMFLTIPTYLLATIGLAVRAFLAKSHGATQAIPAQMVP
jgi:hypothetical protein